ncbi:Homeodomain-like protein [Spinellus fusiger]|nr:Homeodomain-like protein [Spinellus fusiger]
MDTTGISMNVPFQSEWSQDNDHSCMNHAMSSFSQNAFLPEIATPEYFDSTSLYHMNYNYTTPYYGELPTVDNDYQELIEPSIDSLSMSPPVFTPISPLQMSPSQQTSYVWQEKEDALSTPKLSHPLPYMLYSPSPQHKTSRRNKRTTTYSRWTPEEDEVLRQAIALHGPTRWSLVATHVPNRSPMQCSTRWMGALNPHIHKGRWTDYEDSILRYSVKEFSNYVDNEGRGMPIPWNKVADRIPNRTGIQCQARWTEALDPTVRKGKWTVDEDQLLRRGVVELGRSWIRIAETIQGRTQRQCRTRWMQLKYKENRQQASKETSGVDDGSSVSSTTEEYQQSLEDTEWQTRAAGTQSVFVVDDFDTQLAPKHYGTAVVEHGQPDVLSYMNTPDWSFAKQDYARIYQYQ